MAAPDDVPSFRFTDLDLAQAARAEIERALIAIEAALGPPTGWRLLQLLAAIDLFRLGRFGLALHRAQDATLPFEQIPPPCRSIHSGPGLRTVREAVNGLGQGIG